MTSGHRDSSFSMASVRVFQKESFLALFAGAYMFIIHSLSPPFQGISINIARPGIMGQCVTFFMSTTLLFITIDTPLTVLGLSGSAECVRYR